jgi:Spy/CpxP family protein refolding chaperone
MKRRTVVATMMAALVACSLGAMAAPRIASRGGEGGLLRNFFRDRMGSLIKLSQDVDLTQEQREKIHQIVMEHRSEIAGVAQPIVEKRRVLRDAVLADKPSDEAIRSAANDLGKAIGEAAVLAARV